MNMENSLKTSVEENYMFVTEMIRRQSELMMNYLADEQIFSDAESEKISSQAANTLKAMHMLDNLKLHGEMGFESFYAACLYTEMWKVLDVMDPIRAPHEDQAKQPQIPLPVEWPSKEHYDLLKNRENGLKVKSVDENDKRMRELYDNPRKFNVYEMRRPMKGRALIINNSTFDDKGLKDRKGTEFDEIGLNTVLINLGFEVVTYNDKTAKEMEQLLTDECQRDHTNYNCFFLFILSHGLKGIVFGTDGKVSARGGNENYLEIDRIRDQFYAVKSLDKKPKVFIIQACQGSSESEVVESKGQKKDDEDEDVPEDFEDEPEEEFEPLNFLKAEDAATKTEVSKGEGVVAKTDGATESDGGRDKPSGEEESEEVAGNSEVEDTTVEQSEGQSGVATDGAAGGDGGDGDSGDDDEDEEDDDEEAAKHDEEGKDVEGMGDGFSEKDGRPFHFYLALPTIDGNAAYRELGFGSWFIQAFIYVLIKYSNKEDLLTLMEKVRTLVSRATKEEKVRRKTKKFKTISQDKSTLIKKFYFFPGMPFKTKKKKTFDTELFSMPSIKEKFGELSSPSNLI